MTYQAETVTVKLPIPIYRRLKRVAEITYRSVEDVLASTVDAALPLDPNLPSDVADDVAAMALMNDDALMAAAESSLSPAQQRRLQQLTEFGGQRRLLTSEEAELAHLLELYNRSVLRRAKALAFLSQRGYQLPDQGGIDSHGSSDRGNPPTQSPPGIRSPLRLGKRPQAPTQELS